MNKEMVISSTSHETRVAILEDDQAVEIFIEREHSRGVVGNIYKGRVSKVLPGMQSAFVDLGLERDAFLYVTDVISPTAEALGDDEALVPAPVPETTAAGDPVPEEVVNGAVATLDAAPEGEAAAATEQSETPEANAQVLQAADATPAYGTPAFGASVAAATGAPRPRQSDRRRPERQAPTARIEELVKEKQEIVVQVVKEPLGTKGARITCHLSLPGRFL